MLETFTNNVPDPLNHDAISRIPNYGLDATLFRIKVPLIIGLMSIVMTLNSDPSNFIISAKVESLTRHGAFQFRPEPRA